MDHGSQGRIVVLNDSGLLNLVEAVRPQRSQLVAGVQHEERHLENTLRGLEPSRRVADHSSRNRLLISAAYSHCEPVVPADLKVFNVHLLSIRAPSSVTPLGKKNQEDSRPSARP